MATEFEYHKVTGGDHGYVRIPRGAWSRFLCIRCLKVWASDSGSTLRWVGQPNVKTPWDRVPVFFYCDGAEWHRRYFSDKKTIDRKVLMGK